MSYLVVFKEEIKQDIHSSLVISQKASYNRHLVLKEKKLHQVMFHEQLLRNCHMGANDYSQECNTYINLNHGGVLVVTERKKYHDISTV